MKRRRVLPLTLAVAFALISTADRAFADTEADAIILLDVSPLPFVKDSRRLAINFRPTITALDKATGTLKGPYVGSWIGSISVGVDRPTALIWGAKVKPGTYALSSLSADAFWNACFDKQAAVFDVAPGEVIYLGQLDPRPTMAEIAAELPRTSLNMQNYYLSTTMPARLVPPAQISDWKEQIGPRLDEAFPGLTKAPEAATIRLSSFKRRRSLLGQLSC